MKRTKKEESLSEQLKKRVEAPPEIKKEYDGDFGTVISTGSTLLDLAISGGRVRGGGLPGGIFVEAFGPSQSGKTVLLSEIAGAVYRQGGELMFKDPESRINNQFSKIFGLDISSIDYDIPNTVTEVFESARKWKPQNMKVINGVFIDSLAALSTDSEMDDKDGFGSSRSKEFSEQLRITCREITEKNYLMVCSNQVRENIGATQYQPKTKTTGGKAIEFYASLRLQFSNPRKIQETVKIAGKEVKRVIGVETTIDVFKSSIWKPYRSAPVIILFDYGIDDIQANLQFIKDYKTYTTYTIGGENVGRSMEEAIKMIESDGLEQQLREEVIDLWEEIESKFVQERKSKVR